MSGFKDSVLIDHELDTTPFRVLLHFYPTLINCMGAVQSWQKASNKLEHSKRGTVTSKMYDAVRI